MKPLSQLLAGSHLPALDGLRACFVMFVILYHGGMHFVPGGMGVTGFFVLSGFLITWLLLKEYAKTGDVSFRGFYLRRGLRIFPAYYAFVVLSIVGDGLMGDTSHWGSMELATAFTYTVNYANVATGHDHPVAHAWSLSIEEQFYLLWPLAFLALARRGWVLRGLLATAAGVLVWRSYAYLVMGTPSSYVYNAFETRLDALAIGCIFAVWCTSARGARVAEKLAARVWYPLPVLVALYLSGLRSSLQWHYTIGFTVDAALLAILLVQFVQLSDHGTWRWLNHPFAVWLGALSYPLYLWHGWGLGSADNIFGEQPLVVSLTVGVAVSILLAAGSYYVLERPIMRLKTRITGRAVPTPRHAPMPVAALSAD